MKRVRRIAVISMLAMSMVAALSVRGDAIGVSVITNPSCGDLVTQNVVLTRDLICPGTSALEVGANGITIDGRGYRVGSSWVGIVVDGFDGATIKNVRFMPMEAPVVAVSANDVVVENNRFDWGAPSYSVYNILIIAANNVRISGNRMGGDAVFGILGVGVNNLDVRRNSLTHNGAAGLLVTPGSGLTVSNNTFARHQIGTYVVSANDVNVTGNSYSSHLYGFVGAALNDAHLTGNSARRTLIGLAGAPLNGTITRNVVRDSPSGGIGILAIGDGPVLAESNTTSNAGVIGQYYIGLSTMEVTRNTADRNQLLGILAAAATLVDGGGNRASGNGDPTQCIGVVCASGIGGFSGPGSDVNLAAYRLRAADIQQSAEAKAASILQQARAGADKILASL